LALVERFVHGNCTPVNITVTCILKKRFYDGILLVSKIERVSKKQAAEPLVKAGISSNVRETE
jgi:hypothetical protein